MSKQDLCSYQRNFLAQFVPGCTAAEWADLERELTCKGSSWDGTGQISVDMLKQLLMHEITEASRRLLGNCQRNCRTVPGNFQIKSERCSHVVFFLCAQISAVEKAGRLRAELCKSGPLTPCFVGTGAELCASLAQAHSGASRIQHLHTLKQN